jgi:hypothetical protein
LEGSKVKGTATMKQEETGGEEPPVIILEAKEEMGWTRQAGCARIAGSVAAKKCGLAGS